MLKLTLEAIQIVDAIDRNGSFAAAAEALHKVPSSISYTVAKLEEQLDVQLFTRHGPKATLTEVGRKLLDDGRWLVIAASDLEHRLQLAVTGFESEIRIVFDSVFQTTAFIDDLRAFSAVNKSTRVRLANETMTGVWEALKNGRADLAISAGERIQDSAFESISLGSVEFVFCVAPSHPLAALAMRSKEEGVPLSKEQLWEHTAIVVADTALRLPTRTVRLLSLQKRITVPDMRAKLALQRAGLGYGYLAREWAAADLAAGRLVEIPLDKLTGLEHFSLTWPRENEGQALSWWRARLRTISVSDYLQRSCVEG